MIEQLELISNQQLGLLKQLSKYQPQLQFQSLADIPSSTHDIKTKQEQVIKQAQQVKQQQAKKHSTNINFVKSISLNNNNNTNNLTESIIIGMNKTQSSILGIKKRLSHEKHSMIYQHLNKPIQQSSILLRSSLRNQQQTISLPTATNTTLHFLQRQLQKQTTPKYLSLKTRLIQYKQQSQRIYLVSQFINTYQQNFNLLNEQKQKLLQMLKQIKGQTTQLVQKQKSLIDMSMAVKQALDYYTYYNKNQFNYACEIASRQLFEDNLQSTLSTVMDAIEFFTQNETYVQSRKHLNFYLASKSKILSFIKSFFIKLLNKQNSFIIKHISQNEIDQQMNTLYPKSRLSLIKSFLVTFPLLKNLLRQIIKIAKQSSKQLYQKQINYLQLRQMEIQQFILSQSNVGLIKYLQKHNYEIYSQVMLNLFTFNRFNFHQNLIFYWNKRGSGSSGVKSSSSQIERTMINNKSSTQKQDLNKSTTTTNTTKQIDKQKLHEFRSKLQFIIQIIITQYLYIHQTCNPTTPTSIQFITTWLYKLILKYMQTIVKQTRQLLLRYKIDPFQICSIVTVMIDHQLKGYLENLVKEQYHSYVMGVVYSLVVGNVSGGIINVLNKSNTKLQQNQQQHTTTITNNPHSIFLTQLFTNTLKSKLLNELSTYCHQNLPKLQLTNNKHSLQQNINLLIQYIPKLQYCPKQADNYLISSLDILIKSIKQINLSIQSRFQCYVWNLISFGKLKSVLNLKKLQLVSKQIRLDFNQSLNIIDKVKRLQRPQSLIKYAQDIFNVIKTGIPSLNELTLDYNKYINQHYDELQSRFLKDILFIYAKNIIQFLQKVIDTKKRLSSQREITSRKNLQQLQEENTQQSLTMGNNNGLSKSTQSSVNNVTTIHQQKSPKSKKQLQKSPQKNDKKSTNYQLTRLCQSQSMKSLYNSYLHSIEKYIKQSKQILQTVHQCKIQNKQRQVKNINNLIREVYQKLFDFLDTFYVTVSEFNSQITSEFEQIAVIKQKQQALWMEKVIMNKSVEKIIVE